MNQAKTELPEDVSKEDADNATISQSIPVQIRLQVGEIKVPFAKLAKLVPGQVVTLNKPLDQELVTVYVNGMAIAVGELVHIDQMVGVQIRRMLNSHGTR